MANSEWRSANAGWRRRFAYCAFAMLLFGGLGGEAFGQSPTTRPEGSKDTSSQMQLAVHKGLLWLSKQQKPDGSYGSESQYGRHVGITSLAALRLLRILRWSARRRRRFALRCRLPRSPRRWAAAGPGLLPANGR